MPAARLRQRWDIVTAIAVGGALGSAARWALATAFPPSPGGVPWATAVENASGAFLLGALMVLLLELWPTSRYVRPLLGVGLLGGYTTFSTYMLETRDLLAGGQVPTALAYLVGTLLAGLLAVSLGVTTGRILVRTVRRRGRPPMRRRSR